MFSSAVIGNLLGEFHAMSYTQVYYLSKPKKGILEAYPHCFF